MVEKECLDIAKPIVEAIVNQMARNDYAVISDLVSNSAEDLTDLKEWVNTTLKMNELDGIDAYGAECDFHPQYEYHQLRVYPFDDESGFAVDYDFTTSGELNDLTLQLEFKKQDNGSFDVSMSVDVM
ncbi:MAG: hypothetical protein K6E48_04230 [Lachnospiraceae bacterium]|nr:hypothetical protein [Lachnospiraceae bacterium]